MAHRIYGLSVALAALLLLSACQPSVAPAPTEAREQPTDAEVVTATGPTPVATVSTPTASAPAENLPSDEAEGIHWYN